jgi:Cytidine deaminase
MNTVNITAKIRVCIYDELKEEEKKLIAEAKKAALDAYSPYSQLKVGAAILLNGGIIVSGNNQENAAYPSGLCAERVALFYANAHYPNLPVEAIAIAAYSNGKYTNEPISPCGACRQVIWEAQNRYKQPIKLYLSGENKVYIIEQIGDLLPLAFA